VPGTGLEPARLAALAPEASASTNSATRALTGWGLIDFLKPAVNHGYFMVAALHFNL